MALGIAADVPNYSGGAGTAQVLAATTNEATAASETASTTNDALPVADTYVPSSQTPAGTNTMTELYSSLGNSNVALGSNGLPDTAAMEAAGDSVTVGLPGGVSEISGLMGDDSVTFYGANVTTPSGDSQYVAGMSVTLRGGTAAQQQSVLSWAQSWFQQIETVDSTESPEQLATQPIYQVQTTAEAPPAGG